MTSVQYGKRETRIEDDALVRGAGHFVDDVRLPNQGFAAFVRSPHACARIVAVDTAAAAAAKGVVAVLTAKDMQEAGVKSAGRHPPLPGRGGKELVQPFRPTLAGERVLYVGEAVAMVVGETLAAAQDAAELVAVQYEESPAVIDPRDAIKAGAPVLHAEAPDNVAVDWPGMVASAENERGVDEAIKSAPHVARVTVVNQRLVVASMETRGANGSYDPATGSYFLRACSQSAGTVRNQTAAALGVANDKVRVVTEDVGGAFGMKTPVYPEYLAVLVAAKKTGRPVHWMATRSEAFLTDTAGRDTVTEAELALDASGKFLALRMRHLCGQGAYVTPAGIGINTNNVARCLPGMYHIPKIDFSSRCVFTNTAPIGPYRGAGRPEANYALDRAVEEAARVTGIDALRLRKKNLIAKSAMPYKTAITTTYDSGDFAGILATAMELSDYKNFNKRRRESAKRKIYRGIGVSCMLEHAGAMPSESALLAFPGEETLVLGLNVQSTGQAHATVFGRILAQRLGIKREHIVHRHGDSAMEIPGFASVGSRSAMAASSAIMRTADVMLAKGRKAASALLEAAESDITYRDGQFEVVGTDRKISLFETAARAKELVKTGQLAEALDSKETTETPLTFPNGVHIAEVEVDPDTGAVEIVCYTAVDDCGNVLNPLVVEGQVQGSMAMGLGQALLETAVYDAGGGQLLTGSFMDYAMPRAADMPAELREARRSMPATTNPLGVKGTGEAGTTAAIAAIMNAIAHAVPNGAADHLDMPATPAKVWAACRKAAQAGPAG
ncbi:MAG TPA: xanthine dehydrogenase family protein molybdopterin-binding subunit [Xanthobacteraceae bacterium]|jgi:carbon-monoxide dehydrogenase large subunit|nr:xanthine dehydrogenase family protein molybdopterin-binding subunit [Xanthobacteraceae bacterium]